MILYESTEFYLHLNSSMGAYSMQKQLSSRRHCEQIPQYCLKIASAF